MYLSRSYKLRIYGIPQVGFHLFYSAQEQNSNLTVRIILTEQSGWLAAYWYRYNTSRVLKCDLYSMRLLHITKQADIILN